MSHADSPDELNALASKLAQLQPAASRLERDRVMFLAGQAASTRTSQRTRMFWPAISGTLAAAAALLAMVVVNDRIGREALQDPDVSSQATLAGEPFAAPGTSPLRTTIDDQAIAYWQLRSAAFDDQWPLTAASPAHDGHDSATPNRGDLLKELLGG